MTFNRLHSDINDYVTLLKYDTDDLSVQPSLIKQEMKPHQLMTLAKCLSVEKGLEIKNRDLLYLDKMRRGYEFPEQFYESKIQLNSYFGSICDPVGSGKTLTVLALACQPLFKQKKDEEFSILSETGMTSIDVKFCRKNNNPVEISIKNLSAIVVQSNLVQQWKNTIETFTDLKYILFLKTTDLEKELENNKEATLVIIPNNYYEIFYQKYNFIKFNRVFYDEADNIKLPNCKQIKAHFYWFVTASYKSLYGETYDKDRIRYNGFIKNTFKKTDDEIKKYLIIRNEEEFIHKSFKLEDYLTKIIICKPHKLLNILENVVSDRVQQMICAGDIEGAMQTFNLKATSEDNIISIVCNDLFEKLNNKIAKLAYVKSKQYSTQEAKEQSIEKVEKSIDKVRKCIDNIQKKLKDSELDPITYMEIENPVVTTCCKTVFDFESITMYILSKPNVLCPICRIPVSKDNLVVVNNRLSQKADLEETKEEWNFRENNKIDNIKYIIDNVCVPDARILIFSEFDKTSNVVSGVLKNYIIKQIKGHVSSINKTIEWFKDNSKEKKILFLNAQFAGAGLNLENATDVFIYHDMASDITTQVIGRAHRPGRKSVLNVYKFEE